VRITKSKLKEVYHKIDNKITGIITRLGSSEEKIVISHPEILVRDDRSLENLFGAARRYDVEDFFVLHKEKEKRDLSIGYRLLLKSYQGSRDGAMSIAKKIYKLRYDR